MAVLAAQQQQRYTHTRTAVSGGGEHALSDGNVAYISCNRVESMTRAAAKVSGRLPTLPPEFIHLHPRPLFIYHSLLQSAQLMPHTYYHLISTLVLPPPLPLPECRDCPHLRAHREGRQRPGGCLGLPGASVTAQGVEKCGEVRMDFDVGNALSTICLACPPCPDGGESDWLVCSPPPALMEAVPAERVGRSMIHCTRPILEYSRLRT